MCTGTKCLAISFTLILVVIIAFVGCSQQSSQSNTISSADRALAMWEVQNAMSRHAYYHQIGQHCEELEDVWVKEDGPYGDTATWTSSGGVEEGIALIKENYCTQHLESQKQTLEQLSKVDPTIKNVPENIGAGSEYVMHTQETPVIEVAGDGQTAKGIWYSIGLAVRGTVAEGGQTSISTGWMWEKYAADFAKEDGKWKIWHFVNVMDQAPAESGGQGRGRGEPPAGGQAGGMGSGAGQPPAGPQGRTDVDARMEARGSGRQVTRPNPDPYSWSPTVVPRIYPRFPEPYYTFSETFSY